MAYAISAWVLAWVAVAVVYRRHLAACWREPVLLCPVLIIESDDWGAGPDEQASALTRLASMLGSVRDETGRPAVMTLGVVPCAADHDAWRASGIHVACTLGAERHSEVLRAMHEGIRAGVFSPQLHGMEHYWPAALLRRAAADEGVRRWLGNAQATTESLPDALQSRWTDAGGLPSKDLPPEEIARAVAEEVALFQTLFGTPARVAVPNTFVWNDVVEQSWAKHGVSYVVTPGVRYEARATDGSLVPGSVRMVNGDPGCGELRYVVRDVYFEPARGHAPEQLLSGLLERACYGRPCLVETHRFNFLGTSADASFVALKDGLAEIRRACPDVRFMSTAELGDAMASQDEAIIETRISARLAMWPRRIHALSRFRKLAWATGLAVMLHGVGLFAGVLARRRGAAE